MTEAKPTKPNYAQMSAGVIDASLAELGIAGEGLKTIPAKVQALVRYFKSKNAKLADCTVCGGMSDENFPRCPYCGDSELVDPEDAASGAAMSAVATNILKNAGAAPAKPKREKRSSGPTLVLVPPEAGDPEQQDPDPQYTVKDLDRALAKAVKHGGNAAKEIWTYGQVMLEIYGKALWRLRKDEAGNPKYSTWNKFCSDELKMSAQQVYRAMGVSKTYDAETIAQVGVSKLSLTLTQPEDERKRMLEEIKGGASKRDLEKMRANNAGIREIKAPGEPDAPSPAQIAKAKDVAVMVRAPKAIEIVMLGLNTKGKPAIQLSDEPWAEEEHDNGVITRYAIRTDPHTSAISLVITRRRASGS